MTIVEHQAGDHQTHHSRWGDCCETFFLSPLPYLGVHSTGPRPPHPFCSENSPDCRRNTRKSMRGL